MQSGRIRFEISDLKFEVSPANKKFALISLVVYAYP
jgi:hypothetical protein